MEEESFRLLVKEIWKENSVSNFPSIMATLARNLMELKKFVVDWERKRKIEKQKELTEIESKHEHLSQIFSSSFSVEIVEELSTLEPRKS